MKNKTYGYFNKDGSEYIITDPKTPRPFDNFIWNDSLFANVQQTGTGYTDYQIDDFELTKLSTGIGRICDFDVFGRDSFMNRLIYIKDNDTGEFWNVGWEPVKKACESYECRHGIGYSVIANVTDGIKAVFRLFVPIGKDPVELWTLTVESETQRNLSIFVYSQISFKYMWGFNSYGDMLYRDSFFSPEHNMMVFTKHPMVSPHEFQTGFMAADKEVAGFDGSKDSFVGMYNTLNEPEAVVDGKCRSSIGSSDATISALQFDLPELNGNETINIVFGVADTKENAAKLKNKYLSNIKASFEALKLEKQEMFEHNKVISPDHTFNFMLNRWNKQQALFGAQWCRWGWMGYRDIVQHGMGVSNFRSDLSRNIIITALEHQYSGGLALRGWNPDDTKEYSDSALWMVFTLTSYLKETGDIDLLAEDVPFYDKGTASVLEHIDRALDFLEANKGIHDLLLIKFGDWNDSLTGIGKEGRGESVWLSMAYAEALKEMAHLAEWLKDPEKQNNYLKRYESIIESINTHAWDGKWYLRGFCDNGLPIGSHTNTEGRIYLNVQSWAFICGAAKGERKQIILDSVNEMLDTPLGYQLITPTYKTFDPVVGRVTALEPGICENGTVYSHGNAFFIKGLYAVNEADLAYKLYQKVTPAFCSEDDEFKKQNPAYVYANGYFGPEHRNSPFKMEFSWVTGSIAWFYNILFDDLLGIKRDYDGIRIAPQIPASWDELEAVRNYRGRTLNIKISRNGGIVKRITLNGENINDNFISLEQLQTENKLIIELA